AGRSQSAAGQPGQWLAAGAAVIGGCCRVGPAGIAEIARTVADAA
ncbi:MAG: homocysteine S-methyltransferase family protein, partial [Streptosporangiaceae bacterium]